MRRFLLLSMLLCQVAFVNNLRAAQYAVTTGLNNNPTFNPPMYNLNVGDTITWFYAGDGSVAFCTENDAIPVGAAPWSEPLDNLNGQYSYVPTVPGTYNYKCGAFPGMVGQFIVTGCTPPTNVVVSGNGSLCLGGSDTLTVTANDAVSYQWLLNGSPIVGETWSTYYATAAGTYTCEALNSCDTVTSNTFVVTSGSVPPTNVVISGYATLCESPDDTLSVTSSGGTAYQWQFGGFNIIGETNSSYVATVIGDYSCIVYNSCGDSTISSTFTITDGTGPTNVAVSGNTSVCEGDDNLLTVTSIGGVTYQWYINGTTLTGATSATYNATFAGSYTCTAYNSCDSGVSNSINVVINPAPSPVIGVSNTGNSYSFTGTAPGATSWNWDFGDVTTSLLQNPQHTYVTPGNYSVVLTVGYANGCSRSDTVDVMIPTGVKTELLNRFVVSPNPAKDFLEINTTDAVLVEVYDVAGKRIAELRKTSRSGTSSSYDISNIPSGMYLLHVKAEDNASIIKFAIVK